MDNDAIVSDISLKMFPFANETKVNDFIICKADIDKPEKLEIAAVYPTENFVFYDRILPKTDCSLVENSHFPKSYFIDLHNAVKSYGVHNYRGARIPLAHNNIDVMKFRQYLSKYEYPNIQLLQFVEFGTYTYTHIHIYTYTYIHIHTHIKSSKTLKSFSFSSRLLP